VVKERRRIKRGEKGENRRKEREEGFAWI